MDILIEDAFRTAQKTYSGIEAHYITGVQNGNNVELDLSQWAD